MDDAKSIVTKAYATFASGDTDAWAALHADDLVFTVFGDIATSGRHVGPQAVIENVFGPIASSLANIYYHSQNYVFRWQYGLCSLRYDR